MVLDNAQPPFIVGGGMTVADVRLAEVLTGYLELLPECLDPYPELLALQQKVCATSSVDAYLQSTQRWKFPTAAAFNRYCHNVKLVLRRPMPAWVVKGL